MEKFEVYKFDGVFYTLEEIEVMGIKRFSDTELEAFAARKHENYNLTVHDSIGENTLSLKNFLKHRPDRNAVFLKDFGEHGVVVNFKTYSGIQDQGHSILFSSSSRRDSVYADIEMLISERMLSALKEDDQIKLNSDEFQKQQSAMRGRMKLLKLAQNMEKAE